MPPISYLPLLPTELWLLCWSLCSHRQLRRLSLVCHLFRSLCLPLLFQNQTNDAGSLPARIQSDDWIDNLKTLHRTALRLERLAKSPHVASVHSWKFVVRPSWTRLQMFHVQHIGMFDTINDWMLTTFSITLGLYVNLRSVELRSVPIDLQLRDTISALSMLRDLTLVHCQITARDGFPMALKTFSLSGISLGWGTLPATSRPLRIVDPGCIHSLRIDAKPDSVALVQGFGSGVLPQLVDLSLQELFDSELFLSFLKQCPHLESLAIQRELKADPPLPKYLPADTVPRLRHITGPRDLVGLFVLNRPVSAVTLLNFSEGGGLVGGGMMQTSVETFMPVFRDILHSSMPTLSLSLPSVLPSLDLLEAIASLFTELRELSLIILQPRSSRLRGGCNLSSRPKPLDTRRPELRDDALDNLPDEDISDAEEYAPRPIVTVEHRAHPEIITSTMLHTVLNWIACNRVSFPPLIEVLRFQVQEEQVTVQPRVISLANQHRVIAALSHEYPHLREVQIGYPSNLWKRDGVLWKSREDSTIQVVTPLPQ
ncbi:hypothetical protein B0H11DRAFT_2275865 [Mycena galericulata]|nr:hypothetical protein B0H11DRAFT_2275865 [Mycena galericulata]